MANKKLLVKINVRIPEEVLAHFKQFPNYTKAVRSALVEHVERIENQTKLEKQYEQTRSY